MKLTVRLPIAVVALLSATQLFGASFATTSRVVREFPIDASGSVWIDNPFGSIDVIGGDGNVVSVSVERMLTAADPVALKEGADAVEISLEGGTKLRLMR